MFNRILLSKVKRNSVIDALGYIKLDQSGYLFDRNHFQYPKAFVTLEDALVFCWGWNELNRKTQEAVEFRVNRDHQVEILFQGVWIRPSMRVLRLLPKKDQLEFGKLTERTMSDDWRPRSCLANAIVVNSDL